MSAAEDLKRQMEASYAAIRELDEDLAAGRLSQADHAKLKQRSERQAAALLKRLRLAEQPEPQRPARDAGARPPLGARLRGPMALTVGAVVLLLAGTTVGILLARSTSEERLSVPPSAAAAKAVSGGAAVSPELETLRKGVETEAAPISKLLAFAHLALDEGQIPAAIWAYKRVLTRDAKNAEAITHMGIILYQGGHLDQALERVQEALKIDPNYAHARWDRAQMLFTGKKNYAAATRALEDFLALVPAGEDAVRARAMLDEARRQSAAGGRRGDSAPAPATRPPAGPAYGRRG